MSLLNGGRNLPGRKRCLSMDKREQFRREIESACDELKSAGVPHAVDLAKHICRMKRELMFYDKCMRRAENSNRWNRMMDGEVNDKRKKTEPKTAGSVAEKSIYK